MKKRDEDKPVRELNEETQKYSGRAILFSLAAIGVNVITIIIVILRHVK